MKKESNKKVKGPSLKELGMELKKEHQSSKNKVIPISIILIFLVIVFIGLHIIIPKISILGDKEIEISYNGKYKEEGATAKFLGKDITNKIKTTGTVDTSKIGEYTITYTVKESIFKIKRERTIKVVDKISPIITLEGDLELKICPTGKFSEIGYQASDEYDGDLTDKVEVKEEKDKVTYTVKDSSNNTQTLIRKLIRIDEEKPVITLKGTDTMYLTLSEQYVEPGYIVEDNCSSNLENQVKVTGKVKNGVKGTYTLVYEVEDEAGNKESVERKIIISEKTDPNSGVVKKGTIYLTFDDGPSGVTTGAILDILKEEGVKATFFVTNNGPDNLIKRMYDEGHTVALHTSSHEYSKVYASEEAYFADLKSVSDRVKRITGQTSKIVRFPGGSSNTISRRYSQGIMTRLSEALFSQGYRYYDWNIDSGDASSAKTKEAVYNNVTRNLSKSRANMVLMHDIKYATKDAIRDIIRYGKNNGYNFEKIDMNTYMVRQKINN